MQRFPSGGLNQSEMIDHIKFIAKGLFQEHNHSPLKLLSNSHIYRTPPKDNHRSSSPYDTQQCFHRINDRTRQHATQPAQKNAKKKLPIFKSFQELWQKHGKKKPIKQPTPIIDIINKNIYNRYKHQHHQLHELANSRGPNKQQTQQIWQKFLKRESQWLDDKKKTAQYMTLAEQSRRASRSVGRRLTTQYSPTKHHDQAQLSEVEQSIRILKQQTEKLKSQVVTMSLYGSPEREETRLMKTYQYWKR